MREVRGRALLAAMGIVAMMAAAGIAALAVAGAATAKVDQRPARAVVGDIELIGDGGFSPMALPRHERAPIAMTLSGAVRSISGGHPPALRELLFKFDEDGTVDLKGHPTCSSGPRQQDTGAMEGICKEEIVGRGTMRVEIEFPDGGVPIEVSSDLLVLNGGVRKGVTTLYLHAYITVPVPAAIVTTVKIQRIDQGRYGWLAIASIPKIAGGSGSITDFSLGIEKRSTRRGERVSVLGLRCSDRKIQMRTTAVFADGTRASLEIARPCRPLD